MSTNKQAEFSQTSLITGNASDISGRRLRVSHKANENYDALFFKTVIKTHFCSKFYL